MKPARFLIRLANTRQADPTQSSDLLQEVRRRLDGTPARAINLRVSPQALEFDLFVEALDDLELLLDKLAAMGTVITRKRLDVPPPAVVAQNVVAEARQLFNEARYWEVHEVLEGLWRLRDGDEKQLIQGLILAAAALVHRQKNENAVVPSMLKDALRRLSGTPEDYYGWKIAAFRKVLEELLRSPEVLIPEV